MYSKEACCCKVTPKYVRPIYQQESTYCNIDIVVAGEESAPGPVSRSATKPKNMGESYLQVPVDHPSDLSSITGAQSVIGSLPTYEGPARGPETPIEQLLRLDTSRRPGLSELEFTKLFARCSCGLIMTRRVFRDHICIPAVQAPSIAFDLTAD